VQNIFIHPLISISIVNLNGREYLKDCLSSIKSLNYPQNKLEIILVDNGSSDDSVKFTSENYPDVKIIKNSKNLGFAAANNQAAKAARGEYIAFLNNDTKVDKNWLIELLRPIYRDREVVVSGSKVLSMDGKNLDFVGGMINFEGKGFQIDYGVLTSKDIHNQYKYLPFANGGALLASRQVFLDTGGFDEDFFAYYEDVDFGWRLWVLGYRVVFAPKSIVYHVHHGTSKVFSEDKLRFLKERNSLYSVFKNYDDENLAKSFSATLASVFNRIFVDFKFDYTRYYDFNIYDSKSTEELSQRMDKEIADIKMSKEPLASFMAVKDFFSNLSRLKEKRKAIQKKRKRDDKAVFTYFRGQFLAVSPDKDYQKRQIDLLELLGIYKIFEKKIRRKLLIISSEIVAKEMAGPAIRAWNFAKVISQHMDVTLAAPNKVDLAEQEFKILEYRNDADLREIIESVDIILSGGMTFAKYQKSLKNPDKYLIIDIYDPYNLATLAEYENEPMKVRLEIHESIYARFNEQFYWGDFFICASERQRDFWLGMLAALNRVNPYSYNLDPTLKKIIDVVPFGLPTSKPVHTEQVLKGKVDGIGENDFVILWGGGIYNWFDPLVLVKAMVEIGKIRGNIKLYFMGVKHPNPEVKELRLANEAISLAKKLNVYNKNVFFNFGWVEYGSRQNFLLESDVGIITHPEHIETRFSYRTRILDYLWAGLPVISTQGDSLSELVERNGLGITVKGGSVSDIVKAVTKLAGDKEFYNSCVKNTSSVAVEYHWEKICQPIIDFCKDPVSNAVKKKLNKTDTASNSEPNFETGSKKGRNGKGAVHLTKRFFYHTRRSGPKKSFKFLSNYFKKK